MAKWKIFINFGTEDEFRMLNEKVFETRKKAENFCKSNPLGYEYPLKCVMREEDWEWRKSLKK